MADARQYRPGSRNGRFRRINKGAYTEQRLAWLNTVLGQAVLMYYPKPEVIDGEEVVRKESGPTVKILLPQFRGPTVSWDLTYMTGEELDKLRDFFALAFELAEPVVRERDRIANEAFAAGDDSFSRVYRQVPQFIVRQRQELPHGEGVLDGSENVLDGDADAGGPGDTSTRVRGTSDGLVDDNSEESSSQDDNPQAD